MRLKVPVDTEPPEVFVAVAVRDANTDEDTSAVPPKTATPAIATFITVAVAALPRDIPSVLLMVLPFFLLGGWGIALLV